MAVTPAIIRDTGAVITNVTTVDQTASFATAPAAGNAIIAYGNCYNGNGLPVTALAVSDNQGGTSYSQDAAASLTDGNGPQAARIGLYSRLNITTGTPFTVTWDATGGGTPYWFVVAFEVAGLAASPVDSGGGATVSNVDLDNDVSVTGGALAQAENLAFAGLGISTGANNAIALPDWTVEESSTDGLTSTEGAIASRITSTKAALTAAWSHGNYVGDVEGRGCGLVVVYKGADNGVSYYVERPIRKPRKADRAFSLLRPEAW
jgi:hypothetical protein